ncbi:hypothetical protein PEPS_19240 [Persicobacter psychrovividus]|uniref:Lysylphosphatidylglycerol synthase-like protein n=2 Tax=Persicobacter psychrovividus TaxID=387638 RepID=A0ABN6L934_9BACT|nr:hypothetical protein PEPS_19240 [Persicobacter psychrovividus]
MYVLWSKIKDNFPASEIYFRFGEITTMPLRYLILGLLMVLNWSMEAWKWQWIVRKHRKISFFNALAGVWSALAFSLVGPMGLGHHLGRILSLQSGRNIRLILPIFMGQVAQMSWTLLFGLVGLWGFLQNMAVDFWVYVFLGLMMVVVALVMGWRYIRKHPRWQQRLRFVGRYFSRRDLLKIWLLSLGRYLVFCFQLLLLMHWLGVALPVSEQLQGVFFMFLAKSVIPAVHLLGDLGIREFALWSFFHDQVAEIGFIVGSGLILWCFNIFIPALLGSFFLFKWKWFNSSS